MTTYTPETIDTSHISLGSGLKELVENWLRIIMIIGPGSASRKVGVMDQRGTTTKKSIPISFHTTSSLNQRKSTTARQSSRRSRQSLRWDMK